MVIPQAIKWTTISVQSVSLNIGPGKWYCTGSQYWGDVSQVVWKVSNGLCSHHVHDVHYGNTHTRTYAHTWLLKMSAIGLHECVLVPCDTHPPYNKRWLIIVDTELHSWEDCTHARTHTHSHMCIWYWKCLVCIVFSGSTYLCFKKCPSCYLPYCMLLY